jgi:glycerol-3-phosphate dehydrogenase
VPTLKAEALFAIRHELAASVADVLAQRLRLTLLCRGGAGEAAGVVAGMLAHEHGWSGAQRQAALEKYRADVAQYAVPD